MRTFFVWLLLSWLAGIILGVLEINLAGLLAAVSIQGFIVWWRFSTIQSKFAGLLLLFLGFVYGAAIESAAVASCAISQPALAQIKSTPELRRTAVRFRAVINNCHILVNASTFSDVQASDIVSLQGGKVQLLSSVRDYSPGYAKYLERQGISGTWQYPNVTRVSSRPELGWRELSRLTKLRDSLRYRIQKLFVEPDASLAGALLLGEVGTLPPNLVEQFRATGVSHVLAISGSNVALLAGLVYFILALLSLKPWVRTNLVIVLLWFYILMINAPMSAVRAAFFFSILLLFFRLHRLISMPTALLVTAAIMLTFNPRLFFDVGFQLSMAAVAGIFLAIFLTKPYSRIRPDAGGLRGAAINLVLISLGAWLATLPLSAYNFSNISLVSLIANLLVVPVISSYMLISILALFLNLIWPVPALWLAYLMTLITGWLDIITDELSGWPGALLQNVPFPWWLMAAYYLGLSSLVILLVRRQGRSWREIWE